MRQRYSAVTCTFVHYTVLCVILAFKNFHWWCVGNGVAFSALMFHVNYFPKACRTHARSPICLRCMLFNYFPQQIVVLVSFTDFHVNALCPIRKHLFYRQGFFCSQTIGIDSSWDAAGEEHFSHLCFRFRFKRKFFFRWWCWNVIYFLKQCFCIVWQLRCTLEVAVSIQPMYVFPVCREHFCFCYLYHINLNLFCCCERYLLFSCICYNLHPFLFCSTNFGCRLYRTCEVAVRCWMDGDGYFLCIISIIYPITY